MAPISRKAVFYWVPALLALGLAFWLRTESSQLRLFHADEGVQSYQAWRLIETGEYRYDPREHHGPLLYFVTRWMYPIISDANGELSDAGMRRVPLLFSLATIGFGLVAFRRFGRGEVLLWAAIVGTAPLCVIYGSYYVQEALLTCFSLVFTWSVYCYWKGPSLQGAAVVGVSLGLMHVTKETAVLQVAAAFFAVVAITFFRKRIGVISYSVFARHLALVAGITLSFHCLFFSSFFSNPSGIWDGFAAFFNYAARSQGQGHEKLWFYYLTLFGSKRMEGVAWGEVAFLSFVVLGVGFSLFKIRGNGFGSFVGLVGGALFVLYSAIPYKTPWLMLTPYCLLAYAASSGWGGLLKGSTWDLIRWGKLVLALASLFWLGQETWRNSTRAVFRYASEGRNPYLYMHTTPGYAKLLARLESVKGEVELSVYSPDAAWPLPWHLRDWERVGYWTDLETYQAGGIDLIDTRLLGEESSLFGDGGFWELHGLRPNTLLALRAPESVAEKWIRKNAED